MVEIEEVANESTESKNTEQGKQPQPSEDVAESESPAATASTATKSLTPLQQEGLRHICDGCGEGPRADTTDSNINDSSKKIPLKRCSVCHQVWYHDRTCQQNHFSHHKKDCKKNGKKRLPKQQKQQQQDADSVSNSIKKKQQPTHSLCSVQTTPDKGRSLIANQPLHYGTVLGPNTDATTTAKIAGNSNKNHHWNPMVAPVLLENHRRHRCVVCFGLAQQEDQHQQRRLPSSSDNNSESSLLEKYYPTRICSDACRRTAASFLSSEQQAIVRLYQQTDVAQRPPVILPTAVLLYRLVRALELEKGGEDGDAPKGSGGRWKDRMSHLQSEKQPMPSDDADSDTTTNNENNTNEVAHQQAVCATTWAMMKASSHSGAPMPLWHLKDVEALLQQVKLNGFSVCTGESVALGIGMYTSMMNSNDDNLNEYDETVDSSLLPVAPHWINHDCRPNLIQTFDYGIAGSFPTLRLTVCVPTINPHQELTLSYIDHAMPQHLRQQRVQQDYGFVCGCSTCGQEDATRNNDQHVIGYKCKNSKCCGQLLFHGPTTGHCDTCKSQDVQQHSMTKVLDQWLETIHSVDDDMNNLTALEKVYQSTKQQFVKDSWYVREAGERLLQVLLDLLGAVAEDPQKQYAVAAQAFQLTEELLNKSSSTSSSETTKPPPKDSLALRYILLLYKSIKLRLFLNLHPEAAMHDLERIILPTSGVFFSGNHEMMRQIVQDCCL